MYCLDLLSGNSDAKFRNGLRTVRSQVSHVCWNNDRKLLGSRHVLYSATGLHATELGPRSALHQSLRSADYTALLV